MSIRDTWGVRFSFFRARVRAYSRGGCITKQQICQEQKDLLVVVDNNYNYVSTNLSEMWAGVGHPIHVTLCHMSQLLNQSQK